MARKITTIGALLGYGIAKLCDKVETKVENSCTNQHNVQEIAFSGEII